MKKLLLAIVLIVGCDDTPTEHTHHEHFSCIGKWGKDFNPPPIGSGFMAFCYSGFAAAGPSFNKCDTMSTIHAKDKNQAIDICLENIDLPLLVDTSWCDCEAGINW